MPGKGKQPLSREQLEELVAEIRARWTVLNRLVRKMDAKQTIDVMNLPMVERYMESLDNFIRSCKSELGEL